MKTAQIEHWQSDFGREYTDRNSLTTPALDALYHKNYGVTRGELNRRFLSAIPRSARVLEVGCNEGNQLCALQEMGFGNLYGIEIQDYALRKARTRLESARLVRATAFEIPYPDGFFDVVLTSGVLIHIAPEDLPKALREIYRCSRRWIWGFEYYSPQTLEVRYRNQQGLLWKMDYARKYLDHFKDLQLIQAEQIPYLESKNVDSMFLLSKRKTQPSVSSKGSDQA